MFENHDRRPRPAYVAPSAVFEMPKDARTAHTKILLGFDAFTSDETPKAARDGDRVDRA